jgi:hypothetical protein
MTLQEYIRETYREGDPESDKAIAAFLDAQNQPAFDRQYLKMFPGDLKRARRLGKAFGDIELVLGSVHYTDWPDMLAALGQRFGKSPAPPGPQLPRKAPELWAKRDKTLKENPAQFTRRVYSRWLAGSLTRPMLRDLDDGLYHALSVWEHRHPDDAIAELPTQAEVIDAKIARLADEFTPEELRKLGLAIDARMRRLKT